MATIIYSDEDDDHKTFRLGTTPVLIGRAMDCHIRTNDARVSRRHACIRWDGASWIIEDTGSANGIFVGLERVKRTPLRNGDIVTCGGLVLRLVFDSDEEAALDPSAPRSTPVDEANVLVLGETPDSPSSAALRDTVRFSVLGGERPRGIPLTPRSTMQWSQEAARLLHPPPLEGEKRTDAGEVLGPDLARLLAGQARPTTPRPPERTVKEVPAVHRPRDPARRDSEPSLVQAIARLDEAIAELGLHLETAREEIAGIVAPADSIKPIAHALRRASRQLDTAREQVDVLHRLLRRH